MAENRSGSAGGSLRNDARWLVGDRCRTVKLGEWKNGTIVGFLYDGDVALVQRDGESAPRHFLASGGLFRVVDE